MARIGSPLDAGDPFPTISLALAGGGALDPREAAAGGWLVLLAYRGHW